MKRFDKPNLLSSPIKWFNYTFKLTPTEQHILNFLHDYEEVKETNEDIQKGQKDVNVGLCYVYGGGFFFRPIAKQWPKFSGKCILSGASPNNRRRNWILYRTKEICVS